MAESELTAVGKYRKYIDVLENQNNLPLPELKVLEEFDLFTPRNRDSWFSQLGNSETRASSILDSLKNDGRYPQWVFDEASLQFHDVIVRRKRNIDIFRTIRRDAKILTKSLAIFNLLNESGSVESLSGEILALTLTCIFWWLIDQILVYPDEQLIARTVFVPQAMQHTFLLPHERQPLNSKRLPSLILKDQSSDRTSLDIAQKWSVKFNSLLDQGISIPTIHNIIKRRRIEWRLKGSASKAEKSIIKRITTDLDSLHGVANLETVLQNESNVIQRNREYRKSIAESLS